MQHEILHIKLENGDEAVMIDGKTIYATESIEGGMVTSVATIAGRLSEALGAPIRLASMPVPADADWNWDDVAELIPQMPDMRGLQLRFPELKLRDEQCNFDGEDGLWINVSVNGMAITNPFITECGRFDANPALEYGLTAAAAVAIYEANCARAHKVPIDVWKELSSWEIQTANGGTAWRRDFPTDGNGYCLITGKGTAQSVGNPESDPMTITAYDEHDAILASYDAEGRIGLNNWYEKNVGYRPDEDAGKVIPMTELLTLVAERIYLDASNRL